MGKAAKGSRKGKKAWRANISTADIDDYYEKATKDALAGAAALPSVPAQSLFYTDTKSNSNEPIVRKIEKQREKVLHHESILQKNPFLKPVPSSNSMKSKKKKRKEVAKENLIAQVVASEANKDDDSAMPDFDIWDENNGKTKSDETYFKKPNSTIPTIIPAVEIEAPGCSFNPPFEAHQDSLAKAVADEMQKLYKKELDPQPVPLTVTGEIIPEEEKFFLDADDGDDSQEEEIEGDADQAAQRKKTKKVTRVVLNRRLRRKEVLRAEAEAKKLKNFSKEIDSLPDIMKEIEKEDEEKEKRHTRRIVARQERLKAGPPRIGKRKFEPAPIQVLLSEEITGSLRKLKGCCTLARDRYKSIEKRGLIAPTKRSRR